MTAQGIFYDNKKMYNRLFWLDWISRLWSIGSSIYVIYLVITMVVDLQPGARQTLTLPVDVDYPRAKGAVVFTGEPYVPDGSSVHFTQATMTLAHLGATTTVLLAVSAILAAITSAGLAWCLFRFVSRLREGQPFAASSARTFTAAGILIGGGITLSNLAKFMAYSQFFEIGFNAKYGSLEITNNSLIVDFAPLFIAGVLFAIAGVFRYGATLQRDTDGLV